MLSGYRFSMVDEMMDEDYLQLYGEVGETFSEIIDDAPYEMAVLSALMIYLTKLIGKKANVLEGYAGRNTAAEDSEEETEWTSERR